MPLSLATIVLFTSGVFVGHGFKKDASAEDVQKVQGTWVLVSIEKDGTPLPADRVRDRRLVINGDEGTLLEGEKAFSRSTQKLDATKDPKQIDITQTEGDEKGKITRGIYTLTDDSLTICYVYPGDGRPVEFKAGKDSGCILLKFRREKK